MPDQKLHSSSRFAKFGASVSRSQQLEKSYGSCKIGKKRTSHPQLCQVVALPCRLKMRMSGLCKVEMSAFMVGRGPHGNGANHLEPTRTGPTARVAGRTARAFNAGRGCTTDQDHRPSGAPVIAAPAGARRPGGDSWITRTALQSQVRCTLRAEDSGAGAPAVC